MIPSDYHQSKVLVHLVKRFGWTWIGTIHSDDDYGNSGMRTFLEAAEKLGICIAFSESLHRTDPADKITRIVQAMKAATTRAAVGFAGPGEMRVLFKEISRQNLSGVQWVGSEDWMTADIVGVDNRSPFLTGAMGIAVRAVQVPGLKDFLLAVHPSHFPGNPLVREFWETTFACTLRVDTVGNQIGQLAHLPQCSGNESLKKRYNVYTDLSMDRNSYIVDKTVYVFAHTLNDMVSCVERQHMRTYFHLSTVAGEQ